MVLHQKKPKDLAHWVKRAFKPDDRKIAWKDPNLPIKVPVELNYSLWVGSCWMVQPVVQCYIDPGASSALPNAPVSGFRAKANF